MSLKVSSTYMAADSASSAADNAAGYECSDCGRIFRRDAALRRHREVSHAVAADDATTRRFRRAFANRTALNTHLNAAHGVDCLSAEPSSTTKLDSRGVGKQFDVCDGELLLVENCCIDDEICIAADGGSAEFQTAVTTEECDSHAVTKNNCDQLSRQSSIACSSQTYSNSSAINTISVAGPCILTSVTTPLCNNNNSQTKNKNVVVNPAMVTSTASSVHSRTAVRSPFSCSNTARSSGVKLPPVTSSLSTIHGLPTFRKPQPGTTTGAAVTASTSALISAPSTGRLVPVCRATVETPKLVASTRGTPSQRTTSHAALQQKPPKSPLEAETFQGDAHKPGDGPLLSGFVPTSTTQKIIVYVKTEANHQQQIAYCAAESTTPGAGKGSSVPCQFVCPVCGRDFASEKYLSMHVSSIHRAANDVASVIALETAAAPTSVSHKAVVAGSPNNVVDVSVALTATATGTMAAQPSSSTSIGGSKSHWTCNICKKAFAQNSSYKNHIRTHSDDRPYVCGICSIGFKERYHLKKHELFKHTTALNETCRICGKRFKDSTAVRAHERIHSDVRPYGCTLCGKTFKTSECLWHHENRSKTCGKMASRNKHLAVAGVMTVPHQRQRRAAVNHAVSAVPTSRQPRQTSDVTSPCFEPAEEDIKPELSEFVDLKVPVTEYEKLEDDSTAPVVESSGQEVVEDSELIIKTEPECELFDVNLNSMLESSNSDTSFADFWRTLDDLDSVTPEYDAIDNGFPSSPDPICSSPDTTDADSTRSAEEVTPSIGSTLSSSVDVGGCAGMKRYDCARCDKRFASSATLEKHLQVHAEIRPYRCVVCDIGFKLKVHLKKHNLYRHSEEYPCKCSICGKRFKDSSAVRLHERIHSTARPFQCLHCGKSFKTRENLWGHRNRGPCEQRSMSSLLVTSPTASYPVTTPNMAAPQFVANNVRLFHSAEFGPILGVPVNAKLVFKDAEKTARIDEKPATVAVQQLNVNHIAKSTTAAPVSLLTGSNASNLRRVSAIRVGDTTRLAVSKIPTSSSNGGLSLVSVPTAVVTPIKREMISDQKLSSLVATTSTSVLAGNFVLPASSATNQAGNVVGRKRPVVELCPETAIASPHKYFAVASAADDDDNAAAVDKLTGIQRLLSSPNSGDTLLSPNMEQNLADALSALAGQTDAMVVEGDCLPPIGDTETDWPPSTDYDAELNVQDDDWSELVAASCDQLLSSTDEDDDAGSLSDYHRLMSSPSLGDTVAGSQSNDESGTNVERTELASDTMWCNWAPENDLGSLLIFGP